MDGSILGIVALALAAVIWVEPHLWKMRVRRMVKNQPEPVWNW